ncbi:MAG: T9SS type A sorting domain-containing protein [Bacteroidota bacterium]
MKSQSKRNIFVASFIVLFSQSVLAQTTYYSRQSGSWNDPNTWSISTADRHTGASAAQIPGSATTDEVVIAADHVVDYNAFVDAGNSATIATLTVGTADGAGDLRFPFSNHNPAGTENDLRRNFTLIVSGDVSVAANGSILSVNGGEENPTGNTMNGGANNRTHTFSVGGNLTNLGEIDLQGSTTSRIVNLVFNGAANQFISGEGVWDTYNVTYNNTGTFPNNQITNPSESFTNSIGAGRSNFTEGTYVHNNAQTYNNQNNSANDYTNVSFIIQDGVFNMVVNRTGDGDVILTNGNITVTSGQFNGGNGGVGSGNAPNIIVDGDVSVSGGGILNVGDGDPGTSTTPTDGTLTIGGSSSLVNNATLYTRDLTLNAGAALSIENGSTVSVGRNTGGSITMNGATGNGSSLSINGATTQLTVYDQIVIGEDCSVTMNDGSVSITPASTIANNPESIRLGGANASWTMLAGTLNVMVNVNDRNDNDDALRFQAANNLFDIQGGVVVLGNTATGAGNIDFLQAASETASLSISNSASVTVANRIQRGSVGSISNISVSDNASLLVGTDNSSGNVDNFTHEGTLTVSNDAVVQFGRGGDLENVTITENGTLEVGVNGGGTVDINGTFTYGSATATCTFYRGLDLEAGAALNISAGAINVLPNFTSVGDTRMRIYGDLTMDGGTINLGASVTSVTNGRILQVEDGGSLTINTGTFNVLDNAGLTSIPTAGNQNPFNIQGSGAVTVGDGTGATSSAQLVIAPNLAEDLPTPATSFVLDLDGASSILTVNSDGYLGVGGGNTGNLRLNTGGARFVMNGGTCDVTASLTLDDGTALEVNGGTLNIGTTSSNGTNRIIYSQGNPTSITSLILNDGTINVGDGNSILQIGNDNESPAFGDAAYSILEITGGTFNLNGAFNLDDANARFVMSGGNFNLNPQGDQDLDADVNIFDLEQGIVDISGGINTRITIVNPHASSGSGYAMRINGTGGAGNGNDQISGTTNLPSADSPITFDGIFRFGDGSASLNGSTDGFDLSLSDDHTYGSFIVNNLSGDNRQVEIINTNNAYTIGGNLIVTAGIMDIGNNTVNSSGAGIFSLAANGHLIIGNTNSADHFPGSTSGFSTYSVDARSIVEYDGAGNALVTLPGGAQFGNLITSGSGTKTLNAAETVRTTLTLESGTFAAGTNLTMGAGSTVLRTDGFMTGSIQGGNAYTVSYEGTTKSTQSPEWSGSGDKSFIVNLDVSETLTLHDNLTAQGSLTLTEGTLADAGYTLTVGGNVTNSSLHTGTGRIYLAGSSAQRTIGGDGAGQFENLELDDTNGAVFSAAQTINGTLTLTNGVLDIDNFLLALPTTATVSAATPSATTMIQVNSGVGAAGVQRTYAGAGTESFTWPIGANGKYTPATIEVINATSGGTVTLNPVDAENPFTTDASNVALDYYWIVSKSGFGFETANLSFTYDQIDADGRGNESGYVPARYAPTSWTNINNVALVDEVANTISFNNVTYIEGQFTAAEPSEFGIVLTYYSRTDGDWNTSSSWSTVGLGGAAATTIPGSSTPVIIGNNNTITISNDNTASPSLELQSTGTLLVGDATTGHNFGTVSGEGTLRVETNDTDATEFPGGSYTDFLGASGGTVDYTGTGDYTVLDSPTNFRNLTISGSGTVTLPDADISLLGDFTVDGTATTLVSNTTNGNIVVGGNLIINNAGATLQLQSGTDRTVTVSGDVTNTGTLQVIDGGSATHSLTIDGSFTNNGTLDFASTIGLHRANVTFTGAANASVSGTGGTTEFYRLIVDKGTDSSAELDVTSINFALAGPTNTAEKALEIQNGTFKLSAAHTIVLSTGGGNFSVPATGGLWINDAGAVAEIISASSNISLAGLLRITDGTINIGDDLTGVQENSILYTTGNAAITVEGGTLTVGMAIRPNPDAATLVYTQSGGLVQVADNKPTTETNASSVADFSIAMASGSEFNMSGGTLEIVRRNNIGDGKGLRIVNGITYNVSGGTLRIVTAETGGGSGRDIGIASGARFWDVEIGEAGATYGGYVGGNRTEYTFHVLNNFTLNISGGFKLHRFDRDSPSGDDEFDLRIGGNLTVERGTFGFPRPQDGEGEIEFNGTGTQVIADNDDGAIAFFSFEIDKPSGTLQLASGTDISVEKDFTYTQGTFDQNSQLITFNGSVNQTISGNAFSLDDVTINNSTGVTVGVSQLAVNGNLNLDAGVLNLGANRLALGETATITTTGAFGIGTMIQTNGLISDLGVQKAYSTLGGSFTFPIGTDVYSPATINVTDADGVAGTVAIHPVNSRDFTAPSGTSLDYQWIVETTGFGANLDISHTYSYDETDVAGTETDYLDAYFDGISWTEGSTTNVDESANIISLTTTGSINEYQFTAGEGFTNPTVYYSRITGNWDIATTWSTDPSGTPIAGTPPTSTNPVIIQNGHTVTIPVTTSVTAASTTIEGTGEVVIEEIDGNTYVAIGTVGGTGMLKFSVDNQPDVPILDSDFISAGGGTIEYEFTSTTDEVLPTDQTEYNNLIIDHQGGNDEARLLANYTINGDVSVVSGRFDVNTYNCDRGTSGGTFTIVNGAELWVEGSDNFPSGFATYSLDPGSTVRYDRNGNQTVDDLGGDSYGNIRFVDNGGNTKIRTLSGDIIVASNLIIEDQVTLNSNNHNISIQGNWRRDPNAGSSFLPGTGTVTFNGSGVQEINFFNGSGGETFYNVVINNISGVNTAGNLTQINVNGNLTFTNGTLNMSSDILALAGNLINNTASTAPITNASTVTFNSTLANQEVNGTTGVDFGNVTLAKASGTTLSLNVPVSISGTLDMQNDGNIVLSGTTNDLTFGVAATTSGSFSSNRMIVTDGSTTGSQVIKAGNTTANSYDFTFPIGVGSSYTPVTIDATAVTTAGGSIGIRSVDNPAVNSSFTAQLIDPTRAINRFFTLDLSSITSINGSFDFTYADGDIQGNEINYLSWIYNGSFNEANNGFVTPGTNTFGSTDITVSDASTEWVAGEAGAFFARLYSQRNGLWSNNTNVWNTAADGSGIFMAPTEFNEVEIQSDHTITTDASDQDAAALILNGTLDINGTTDHDFGIITGTDTLILQGGALPGFNVLGTTFFDNGTVEYTGASSYTLPTSVLQYFNLVISGSGTKTLGSNITVLNDLTIDAATLDADITNNYNVSLGGNINSLSGGSFDPRNGTFALVGASTQSVPSGITFNNLQFDNVGIKNIASSGAFTINDFRILSASGPVNFSSPTSVTLTGSWSNGSSSGASIYSNVQSLTLNDDTDQSISGINVFHNLVVDKINSGHTVNVSGTITLDNGLNGGNLLISTDDVVSGSANFNLLGDWFNSGTFSTSGVVNFNGSVAQSISGDNTFGSLVIDNTAGLTIADNTTTTIADDLTLTSGTLNTGGGTATVVFDGAGTQSINGAVTFNNLTKQAGDTLTLSGTSTVNGTLTLTDGIINTSSSDLLVIGVDGSISGGSGTSYINGPLQHTENSTSADVKLFPFGSGTIYRPITLNLTQNDAVTRTYTGTLNESAPVARTLPVGLVRVSGIRHYNITQDPYVASSVNATVTINYNVDDESDDQATLRIAKSDDSGNWENIGGTGSASGSGPGDFVAGTITSDPFDTFSDFVLASSSNPLNPLPVELLDFQAVSTAGGVKVFWTTASEINNSHFIVERSLDGLTFEAVSKVEGVGNSVTQQYYETLDTQAPYGTVYYRLQQVDFDGTTSFSQVIAVMYTAREVQISVQPNPVENHRTTISASGLAAEQKVTIQLVDLSGFEVRRYSKSTTSGGVLILSLQDLEQLASGLYTVVLTSNDFRHVEKLIIR